MRRGLPSILTMLALVATSAPGVRADAVACSTDARGGGEWPLYGADLSNTRSQPAETSIGPAEVGGLAPELVFPAATAGGIGLFQSTPVIAGGCLYAATDGGTVFALNADTFEIAWTRSFEVAQTRLGGVITGAIAVANGRAFVAVSDAGKPFVIALDAKTGDEEWAEPAILDGREGSFTNASPVPFEDMLFVGFSGDEYVDEARGGYAIVDQVTGAILRKRYTIPRDDFENGYWGGSVWSTAVYDKASRSIFVGTGNPASHDREHRYTNSIIRIDADPNSARFGDIVDAYKGTVDQYYPGLDRQPVCRSAPDVEYGDAWSLTCLQLDLDFGASPNLFRDAAGNLLVGALQKSGVYHAVYTDTMQQAWTSVVGTPCFICNASSPAMSRDRVFAAGTWPGQVVALSADTGGYDWVAPTADWIHYQSVSEANGVVYAPDLYGTLNAFDAETGVLLAKRDISNDVGASVGGVSSSGVAIARNTVYVAANAYLVGYRVEE